MAREIAVVRTHFFNQRIKNAIRFLSDYFGDAVYVACPQRILDKPNPAFAGFSRFIPLSDSNVQGLGLPTPEKWEWSCGDYALYRARAEHPDAEHIWLIEYDVALNFARASDFFSRFGDDAADMLAFDYRLADPAWPWRKRMAPLADPVMRCIFCAVRLSARALDHLLEQRRALAGQVAPDAWPNDESFVATTLTRDGFACRDISEGVRTAESLSWSRPHSIREISGKGPDGLVYHPVVAGDAYMRKARQFLRAHPDRLDEIAATLREECGDDRFEMMRDLARRVRPADPGAAVAAERIAVAVVEADIADKTVRFAVEDEGDIIQSHHAAGHFYEPEELSIIRDHFPAGGVFCDIGANIGNHAVYAGLFLGARSVLAFEPNPRALRLLRLNVLLNGLQGTVDLSHVGIALGSAEGHASMETPDGNLGGNRLDPDDPDGAVEIRTGDSILAGRAVDFLKIDVEGMEMAVLGGLAETIGRCRPPIFVEVLNETAGALEQWSAGNGYRIAETYRRYATCKNFMLVPERR